MATAHLLANPEGSDAEVVNGNQNGGYGDGSGSNRPQESGGVGNRGTIGVGGNGGASSGGGYSVTVGTVGYGRGSTAGY
ncbi:unnamed protein product, partial [Oppiella nova]